MALQTNPNEQVIFRARIHWSTYIYSMLWALLIATVFVLDLQYWKKDPDTQLFVSLFLGVVGLGPFVLKFIDNQSRHYVLTSDRLYLEEGILSKVKKDIPNNKINDVEVRQGFVQRIFGTGNISILTGNDKYTVIKNIDEPESFLNKFTSTSHREPTL